MDRVHRQSPLRPPRGFTLIEVLIAMSIMAIIAVMSWQGVDGIVRARDISQARVDQVLRLSTVLAQWERDLDSVQETGSTVPALRFDGARLTLTRRVEGGVQLVVWSLREGQWFRWASQPVTQARALQDLWLTSQQFLGNEAGQLSTLADVVQWQLYYFRDDTWSNAQSSAGAPVEQPPVQNPGQPPQGAQQIVEPLPQGVRLVLAFGGTRGLSGTLTRDVAMAPQQ